jgi:translation initiation factor 2 subunit 1
MLYQKDGFPEEGELVLCTVNNVQNHSVFVTLNEFGKSGMIHISEISPGRIRNIRDFVVEGKIIVCKVLRINEERGHIDLSLRRVSENQRRNKVNEIKQEQKAEKIIEFVAKQLKISKDELFNKIHEPIFKNYPNVYSCFEQVINDDKILSKIGINNDLEKALVEVIKQRIKPPEVELKGKIKLICNLSDGVDVVKRNLIKLRDEHNIEIKLAGGGIYSLLLKDSDYKSAEKRLKSIISEGEKLSQKSKCVFSFERLDNK